MCESDDSMIKFSLIRRGGLELRSIFSLFIFAMKTLSFMKGRVYYEKNIRSLCNNKVKGLF